MSKTKDNIPHLTSDALHNRNCYAYFLQLKPVINNQITEFLPEFALLQSVLNQQYNENYPYGNLYTSCIASLERYLDTNLKKDKLEFLDNLILAIYHNDNSILEQGSEWINEIGDEVRPYSSDIGKKIGKKIRDTSKNINQKSPNIIGSVPNRIYSLFTQNFKPQYLTNIPSIKNYAYKKLSHPIEYRFSTQAQRHNGKVRVSRLFERWLEINAEKNSSIQQINHIYFNNLALDRSFPNFAGTKERELTLELHQLENKSQLKVLVITFPAVDGLMETSAYKKTDALFPTRSILKELLAIAKGQQHKNGISDFRISPKARQLLFNDPKHEEVELKILLENSFKAHGITLTQFISTAQKQAVWLHFIKFELTNYILQKIKPKSYNFSCKDAIDRGALSSAYYNLLQSFALKCPIKKEEFVRALDAAAASVKGRGMNFHRKILWNAINSYVNANYIELLEDQQKSWLIFWRDMNCPHSRVEDLIQLRLKQVVQQFKELNRDEENGQIKYGLKLLGTVNELNHQNVSGKRLLLEVISRTSSIMHNPSEHSINQYNTLADELKIKCPIFHILSGLMKALLGVLLYLPSLGYSEKMVKQGVATANTGFFHRERVNLSEEMIQFSLSNNSSLPS